MPVGESRLFMIIDDDPALHWEHRVVPMGGVWRDAIYEPCRAKNDLGAGHACVCCRDDLDGHYPYFAGFYTVIGLTPWRGDNGFEYCFQRELFVPKMGANPKFPGMLKILQRLRQKEGHLRGLVLECRRSAQKTEVIGDRVVVVERVPPAKVLEWGRARIEKWIADVGSKQRDGLTVDVVMAAQPWVAFDYKAILAPRADAELRTLLRLDTKQGTLGKGKQDLDDIAPY